MAIPFPPGQPTQLGRRSIFLDLERRPHSSPHIWCELKESRNRCRGNPRVTSTARWYEKVEGCSALGPGTIHNLYTEHRGLDCFAFSKHTRTGPLCFSSA